MCYTSLCSKKTGRTYLISNFFLKYKCSRKKLKTGSLAFEHKFVVCIFFNFHSKIKGILIIKYFYSCLVFNKKDISTYYKLNLSRSTKLNIHILQYLSYGSIRKKYHLKGKNFNFELLMLKSKNIFILYVEIKYYFNFIKFYFVNKNRHPLSFTFLI